MLSVDFKRKKTMKYSFDTLAKGLSASATCFKTPKKGLVTKKILEIMG